MSKVILIGDLKVNNFKKKIDEEVTKFCNSSDGLVIANLEGPIIEKSKPYPGKKKPLKSSPHVLDALSDLNVGLVTLANNHIADYEEEGILETIEYLEKSGIKWTGVSTKSGIRNQVVSLPKINHKFIALAHREGPVCEFNSVEGWGPTAINNFELNKYISESINNKENLIVSYHGGEEFYTVPWPRRACWTKSLIEKGVKMTIGHHSHSIQPITNHKNGYSFHGLGNFYFHNKDKENYNGTQFGRVIRITLDESTSVQKIESAIIKSNWDKRKVVLKKPFSEFEKMDMNFEEEWISQCKKRVWLGYLPTQKKSKTGECWKKYLRGWVFVYKQLRNKLNSQRDIDIILCALPGLGKLRVKEMKRNCSEFSF